MSRSPQRNRVSGVYEGTLVQCVGTICIQHTHMRMVEEWGRELKYKYSVVRCFVCWIIRGTMYIVL